MSSPDPTVEMAHRIEDTIVPYLMGATEEELKKFWALLMPNISFVGINRIYPIVMEPFRDDYVEYAIDEGDEADLNLLRQPNPNREGTG